VESCQQERVELEQLLSVLYQHTGYDLRHYARAFLERRVQQSLRIHHFDSIGAMTKSVLQDETLAFDLIQRFSITVSEMFRDPFFYRALLKKVLPLLQTYPSIKVWVAGCANGQEVYSLAILLQEAGLLERTILYATDINSIALENARHGIYATEDIQAISRRYCEAGGQGSFSDYCNAAYDAITLDKALKKHITFAQHNLVQDGIFGEMQLILCRNVMIYFNAELQARVLNLFTNSLSRGGFLCLGTKEDLSYSVVAPSYETLHKKERIFQKKYLW
jgi:chemotaxis protein methyltransferase CheR